MPDNIPVPDLDPVALPAPVWLLKGLLLLTFLLHIIPMNFALGGGFVAAVTDFIGRKRESVYHLRLARSLAAILPIAIAFTITLGVAPLLFVQVLYGQFFYTSSILLAWPWLSIIVLLILSYYGFYLYAFRWEKLQRVRLLVVLGSAILFALIGFLYTNNLVLMLTPEKWATVYFQNPHGTNLNLSDVTVIPRYLHFFVASFALAGLLVAVVGMWKRRLEGDYGRWATRYGLRWFLIATVLQFAVGPWFLLSLPQEVMMLFLGGDVLATGFLVVGLLSALASLAMILVAYTGEASVSRVMTGIFFIVITIICMVLMRDVVRDAYLKGYFDPDRFAVEPQTEVIILFFLLLLIGLGVVGYMVRRVVAAR